MSNYSPHYKYREAEPGLERDSPLERGGYLTPENPFEEYVLESEKLVPFIGEINPEVSLEELAEQEHEELVPLLRYWSTSSD